MYYILYLTTNLINRKFYVGIHKTDDLNDGYLGSGHQLKAAIKKYGRKNFKREILQFCDSYETLIEAERQIVTSEFCEKEYTYNVEIGGAGGKNWTTELKEKMSRIKKGSIPWNKGKSTGNFMTADKKEDLRIRMTGSNNHMFGVNVANVISEEKNKERLKKISEKNKKPKNRVDNYKEYAKKRRWMVNQSGDLKHYTDDNDPRLLSGEYQRGKIWKPGDF